jgi:hypothetical protein
MPQTHEITLLVTIDKQIFSTPTCKFLPIQVGDSLMFKSPHGEFEVTFTEPHVFSSGKVNTLNSTVAVTSAGTFAGNCSISLKGGEKIEAGAGHSYGLDGQTKGGSGGTTPP